MCWPVLYFERFDAKVVLVRGQSHNVDFCVLQVEKRDRTCVSGKSQVK